MSYEDHLDDVASDFKDALEGLTGNSRVEITTLTVIARENTEYAHGISEVLLEHIKKVAPAKKLPALYLLDSIVKNVGTPYTIYFSRGLYATFMDAYASVDNGTRRKMDEMLKTWREPVPGSVDPRPVFAPDTVRPIENALMKVRSTTLQAQQQHMRSEQQLLARGPRPMAGAQYRETPTPPGGRPFPGHPGHPGHPPPAPTPNQGHPNQGQPGYPPTNTTPQPTPAQNPGAASRVTLDALKQDVDRLIVATRTEVAEKPYDGNVASRLQALLNLQTILRSQNLEHDKLVLVRTQIDALAVNLPPHLKAQAGFGPTPTPPAGMPFQPPPQPGAQPGAQPPPQPGAQPGALPPQQPPPLSASIMAALAAAQKTPTPQPQQQQPFAPPAAPAAAPGGLSLDALLGKGTLASILAGRQQQGTPQPAPAQPQPQPQPQAPQTSQLQQALLAASRLAGTAPPAVAAPTPTPPPNTGTNPLALMDMLRNAGILPPGAGGPAAPPTQGLPGAPGLHVPNLAGIIASIQSPAFGLRDPLRDISNEIAFDSASLAQFRPHLLPLMYEDLGPPCTQCGRRFRTDDAGRAAKTAHMDWHFRVHQRIVDAEKRGQHRSWYVDQADWVQSRESIDPDAAGHGSGGLGGGAGGSENRASGAGGAAASSAPVKLQWIPAPTGAASTNTICPICQEKFELQWLDEAQEWVWVDAVQVGPRVYHASCHAEATRTGNNRDKPAAAALSALMGGAAGAVGAGGAVGATGHLPGIVGPIPTGPAADRHRRAEAVLGKRKADENGFKAHAKGAAGRKKKRGGLGGAAGRRPPDLDRVDVKSAEGEGAEVDLNELPY